MTFHATSLEGVVLIEPKIFEDHRGRFVKTFHQESFAQAGLETAFEESFYSVSHQGVLRGMHFQTPPYEHAKLVYVTQGEILDVALDIRHDSPTFGHYFHTVLNEKNGHALYMAKGFAHGFLTKSHSATVVYMTSTLHNAACDAGIRWDSFGFGWEECADPILSPRDHLFPPLTRQDLPRDV